MQKDLTISTASVEIHVLRVDGHKMTKATFSQIPLVDRSELFLGDFYEEFCAGSWIGEADGIHFKDGVKVLGKVNGGGEWYLLCECVGKPIRYGLKPDMKVSGELYREERLFLQDESIPQLYIAT